MHNVGWSYLAKEVDGLVLFLVLLPAVLDQVNGLVLVVNVFKGKSCKIISKLKITVQGGGMSWSSG